MNFTHVPTSCLTERCIENLLGFTQLSRGKMFPKPQKRQIVGVQKKMWTASFLPHHNSQYYPPTYNNGFELAKMTGDTDYRCVGNDNPTWSPVAKHHFQCFGVFLYSKLEFLNDTFFMAAEDRRRDEKCRVWLMIVAWFWHKVQHSLFCKLKTLVVSHHTF